MDYKSSEQMETSTDISLAQIWCQASHSNECANEEKKRHPKRLKDKIKNIKGYYDYNRSYKRKNCSTFSHTVAIQNWIEDCRKAIKEEEPITDWNCSHSYDYNSQNFQQESECRQIHHEETHSIIYPEIDQTFYLEYPVYNYQEYTPCYKEPDLLEKAMIESGLGYLIMDSNYVEDENFNCSESLYNPQYYQMLESNYPEGSDFICKKLFCNTEVYETNQADYDYD